jgi:putative membrane protein
VSRPTVAQGLWVILFLAFLIWSGIGPHDYPTWFLEVSPAIVAAGLLWHTRRPFPLTTLSYVLILIHMIILMIGGHYTYAEVQQL